MPSISQMLLLRQSNTMVHALFLTRLDADGMRNSILFPILDVSTFFPLFSIPLMFLSLESGSPSDKVPQKEKIGNIIVLYNASAASDVKLFRNFLIVFMPNVVTVAEWVLQNCIFFYEIFHTVEIRYLECGLSGTFTKSNKLVFPVKVRDSGCRLYPP